MRSAPEATSQVSAKNTSIFRRALDGIKEIGHAVMERVQGISREVRSAIQLTVPLLVLATPAFSAHAQSPADAAPSTRKSIFLVRPELPQGTPVTTTTIEPDLLSPGDQCEGCQVEVRCSNALLRPAMIPGNDVQWNRDAQRGITVQLQHNRPRLDFTVLCSGSDPVQVIVPAFDTSTQEPIPEPVPLQPHVRAADRLSLVFPNGIKRPVHGNFLGIDHQDCFGCAIKLDCNNPRLLAGEGVIREAIIEGEDTVGLKVEITAETRGKDLRFGCAAEDITADPPQGTLVHVEARDLDWEPCPDDPDFEARCRSESWLERERERLARATLSPAPIPDLWTAELQGSVPFASTRDMFGPGVGLHLERRLPEVAEPVSVVADIGVDRLQQIISGDNPKYAPQDPSTRFSGVVVNPFVGAMLGTTVHDGETVDAEVQGGLELGSMVMRVDGYSDVFRDRATGEHADLASLSTTEPAARACGLVRAVIAERVTLSLGSCTGGTITKLQANAGDSPKDQKRLFFANGQVGVGGRF